LHHPSNKLIRDSVGWDSGGKMANQITTVFSSGIDSLKVLSLRKKTKLALLIVVFLGLTVGLSFGSRLLFARINLPIFHVAWLTYLIVFVAFLAIELVPFGPAPIALSILFVTASIWNPLMVGLAAAIGASVGGFGGYFMGILGRRVLLKENFMCSISEMLCNKNIGKCVNDRGPLVIGILAFQPILPFEITGIIAGSLKMPVQKFFMATFVGNSIKYITLALMAGMISSIPFFK
jgi:membrane protein YqaA with SNARE-associated domain